MRHLDAAAYRRLQDLPAVPGTNSAALTYDVSVPVEPDGERWYLRSYGLRFDLVHRSWLRQGIRWYSLGWGIVDGEETAELLLAQTWAEAADLAPVRAYAARYTELTDQHGCTRAAAVLAQEQYDG